MEQQLDFIVLVSYAVPVLKRDIALASDGSRPQFLELVLGRLPGATLMVFGALTCAVDESRRFSWSALIASFMIKASTA